MLTARARGVYIGAIARPSPQPAHEQGWAPVASLRLTGSLADEVARRQGAGISPGHLVGRELRRFFGALRVALAEVAGMVEIEDLNLLADAVGDAPLGDRPWSELVERLEDLIVDMGEQPEGADRPERRVLSLLCQMTELQLLALADGIERWRLSALPTHDYRGWRGVGLQRPPSAGLTNEVAG
ncbi:MAG: hypothetical protein ACYDGN_16180 [Acidimicrobiales bacterium]